MHDADPGTRESKKTVLRGTTSLNHYLELADNDNVAYQP